MAPWRLAAPAPPHSCHLRHAPSAIELGPTEPTPRSAAAGADRRANAPGCPRGELLVPAPSLAAYEWIAERVRGLRVADLACGEGYGAAVLARTAAQVVGVDANPEAHEHARLRYRLGNLRFERGLVEEFDQPCDAIVFLQTIDSMSRPRPAVGSLRRRRAPELHHDAQPAHARPARRPEVRQPLAPAGVHPRPASTPSWSRTSRAPSRPASSTPGSCASTSGRQARLGQGPPHPSPHEALLRPPRLPVAIGARHDRRRGSRGPDRGRHRG